MARFGTTKPYFSIFDQKFLIGIFSGIHFLKKAIVIFEISTLKFVYLENLMKKQKFLNLGPKMPDLGIFCLEIENNNVIFEISTLEFV